MVLLRGPRRTLAGCAPGGVGAWAAADGGTRLAVVCFHGTGLRRIRQSRLGKNCQAATLE